MGQPAAKFWRPRLEKTWPGAAKHLEGIFGFIPHDIREGPWAWAPTLAIGMLANGVLMASPHALAEFEPLPWAPDLVLPRLGGFALGIFVLWRMLAENGPWPFASWTMLGWTCTTMRYLFGALGMASAQRALTFPSLLANSVTVLVWYIAIVPSILVFSPKERRKRFVNEMLTSWFLATVHGFNLPFSIADWYMQPLPLGIFDLWAGFFYGLLYIIFYLGVLDPSGVHFYFILSPRKWWGALTYASILSLAVGIWHAVNQVEVRLRIGLPGQLV